MLLARRSGALARGALRQSPTPPRPPPHAALNLAPARSFASALLTHNSTTSAHIRAAPRPPAPALEAPASRSGVEPSKTSPRAISSVAKALDARRARPSTRTAEPSTRVAQPETLRPRRRAFASNKHKKFVKFAKGYRGRANRCFRIAVQRVEKAWQYAYRDRKARAGVARR